MMINTRYHTYVQIEEAHGEIPRYHMNLNWNGNDGIKNRRNGLIFYIG